ncbi:MAG TPA: hypothetical protein VGM88_04115 [Kofleriaceae bacterium]|jgi:hypothetical protein
MMNLKGAAIAGALAMVFSAGIGNAGPAKDDKAGTMMKCDGGNSCKGKGGCKSAKNDCKGKNSCKGASFTMEKTEKDCTSHGGKVATAATPSK